MHIITTYGLPVTALLPPPPTIVTVTELAFGNRPNENEGIALLKWFMWAPLIQERTGWWRLVKRITTSWKKIQLSGLLPAQFNRHRGICISRVSIAFAIPTPFLLSQSSTGRKHHFCCGQHQEKALRFRVFVSAARRSISGNLRTGDGG